jgi:hypothetical protein
MRAVGRTRRRAGNARRAAICVKTVLRDREPSCAEPAAQATLAWTRSPGFRTFAAARRRHEEIAMGRQRDEDERKDPGRQQIGGTPAEPKPRPRPTWGEQTPDLDQQRGEGGGGTSSDSDGQQIDDQ